MTLSRRVFANTLSRFFAPIDELLSDESVREVLINRYDQIFVERDGALQRTDATFARESHLVSALTNLAQSVGKTLGPQDPWLQATLPDGSRVLAILPPIATEGPCLAIRCTREGGYSLETFCEGAPDPMWLRTLLGDVVSSRVNLLIYGEIASGKTSLLGALSSLSAAHERLIAIEQHKELQLDHQHVVRLVAGRSSDAKEVAPTTAWLLDTALEMRADRIVLGEIHGGNAAPFVRALTHPRTCVLSAVRSASSRDALASIVDMVRRAEPMGSSAAVARRVAESLDIVVRVEKRSDGGRRLASVAEVVGWEEGSGFATRSLYEETQ